MIILAIIWIQSRFCKFNMAAFNTAVIKLAKSGIRNLLWYQYGAPECCEMGPSSSVEN